MYSIFNVDILKIYFKIKTIVITSAQLQIIVWV